MRRRKFLTLLGGAAAAWPRAAGAQQPDRMRRIGWLIGGTENAAGSPANRTAFLEGLARLGWIEGRNLRIDLRFGEGDANRLRAHAAELGKLTEPGLCHGTAGLLQAAWRKYVTQPVVKLFTSLTIRSSAIPRLRRVIRRSRSFARSRLFGARPRRPPDKRR